MAKTESATATAKPESGDLYRERVQAALAYRMKCAQKAEEAKKYLKDATKEAELAESAFIEAASGQTVMEFEP